MSHAKAEDYQVILVESFYSPEPQHRGRVHIRPCEGQPFSPGVFVECPNEMKDTSLYPLGTIFRIKVKEKKPKSIGDRPHLYSSYKWEFEVVTQD